MRKPTILTTNDSGTLNCGACTFLSIMKNMETRPLDKKGELLEIYDHIGEVNFPCGAYIGASMALSEILKNYNLDEADIVSKLNSIRNHFIETYGSVQCFDISKDYVEQGQLSFSDPERVKQCDSLIQETISKVIELAFHETNPLNPLMERYLAL